MSPTVDVQPSYDDEGRHRGGYRLKLDDVDLSHAVERLHIGMPGELNSGPEVVIRLAVPIIKAEIPSAQVELDDATVAALTRLGWRPPSEIPGAL